jgi:hypothetical protein
MAAVALMALLFAGLAAAPAEARTRDDGRKDANDWIAWCIAAGGDPEVLYASEDRITVKCHFSNGTWWCQFYPAHDCYLIRKELVTPGDLPVGEIVEKDNPATRPGLVEPVQAGESLFSEDEATTAPLRSSRITDLGGSAAAPAEEAADRPITLDDLTTAPAIAPVSAPVSAPVAEQILVPVREQDEVVTTQPVAAPVAEEILVPEFGEDEVVTTQPVLAPVAEEIPVPELEEDGVVTIQPVPAPVAEEITIPEVEEDEVVTIQSVPADEQP